MTSDADFLRTGHRQSISQPRVRRGPAVRRITVRDLFQSLRKGLGDFWSKPSHIFFLGLIYPLAGLFIGNLVLDYEVIPLLFPLIAGLTLVGPFVAIGLYDISRRREAGLDPSWLDALAILHTPARGAIVELGLCLMVTYFAWLVTAMLLYRWTFPHGSATTAVGFIVDLVATRPGWTLIVVGNSLGFVFATIVLMTSVVSFPLLIDRKVSLGCAIATSFRAVIANPGPMAFWGAIVAAGMVVGALTLFVGLAVIMPVLGHATWHLYRSVVEV